MLYRYCLAVLCAAALTAAGCDNNSLNGTDTQNPDTETGAQPEVADSTAPDDATGPGVGEDASTTNPQDGSTTTPSQPGDQNTSEDNTDTGDTNNDTNNGGNDDNGSTTPDPETIDSDCPEADTFLDFSGWEGPGGNYPSPTLDIVCTDTEIIVESNGIVQYEFFSTTPNDMRAQNHRYVLPRYPQVAAEPTDIPLLGTVGPAINGVPFYGPNEAQMPHPYGDPIYNDIVDECKGHPGGQGDYHYHALLVRCLTGTSIDDDRPADEPSPIVGYAMDGFPIYGPYGCLDTACSEVVKFQSSWETIGDPETYAWDANEYVEKADPIYLDRCNGRVGPDGTYRYHATDTFPYVLGCYTGTPNDTIGPQERAGNTNNNNNNGPGNGNTGPASCETESDCAGECPDGSVGCTCHQRPSGDLICVPTCANNDDCPIGPAGQLQCNGEGICVPQGAGGGGGMN